MLVVVGSLTNCPHFLCGEAVIHVGQVWLWEEHSRGTKWEKKMMR